MKTTFEEIIEQVLEHEGGYVNDPDDPGGETKYGIAKKFNPDVDIKNLTKEGAKEIYYEKYWKPSKADKLPDRLKHIYFDMVVNMGKSRAVKVLQAAICGKGMKIAIDGGIGPQTIQASLKSGVEPDRLRSYRVKYYADLINRKPKLEKYWYGWYRRALAV